MKLCDTNLGNQVVAEFKSVRGKSNGKLEEKSLEILVPCDRFFVELVVLSAATARSVIKTTDKAILEVCEAVAGV